MYKWGHNVERFVVNAKVKFELAKAQWAHPHVMHKLFEILR
jgi:hypothetical protein